MVKLVALVKIGFSYSDVCELVLCKTEQRTEIYEAGLAGLAGFAKLLQD